jgi:hypothetical protein
MARYRDAVCRLCRREGGKLFLKGDRCFKPSCAIEKRGTNPPGQHGAARRKMLAGYGEQLREKQKVKRIYFILEKARQRRLPLRFFDLAPSGPPIGEPRAHRSERTQSRYSFIPGQDRRHGHGQGQEPQERSR